MQGRVVRVEFTVFPFVEGGGALPDHVRAAVEAARATGAAVDVGPLSNAITGDAEAALEALRAAQVAALEAGATRVASNVEVSP